MNAIFRLFTIVICLLLQINVFAQSVATHTFKVFGNCGMCKKRIEQAAGKAGAKEASWNTSINMLTLKADASDLSAIKKALVAAGHDLEDLKADDHVYNQLHECCQYTRESVKTPAISPQAGGEFAKTSFPVSGVCGMCKKRIEKAAEGKGLASANWDATSNVLTLSYRVADYDISLAKQRILASGHDTDGKKADVRVYEKLPECCHYRDENNVHRAAGKAKQVTGVIMEENQKGELIPVDNATIRWLEQPALATRTDESGVFRLQHEDGLQRIIVSYTGLGADTVNVTDINKLIVLQSKDNQLNEVTVTAQRRSSYISALSPARLETLTERELFKAACCNLSESFETNASVDVTSNDAVTGSKQVQMLGLSGNYTQLTVENLPGPRGLATPLGLNSIAGTWIESIQISKGIGTVANGFENIAGQINVELKKPESAEKLYANIYTNNMGRTDLNLNLAQQFGEQWSGALLLHDNFMYNRQMNFSNNGFRDQPTGNLFSAVNRWKYDNGKGFISQFGIKVLTDKRTGGEIDFTPSTDRLTTNRYGLGMDIDRYEAFAKFGYVFPEQRYRSIGLQLSGFLYDQQSYFGLRTYNARQENAYANLIYQSILGTTIHKYRIGLSLQYDRYDERYLTDAFKRTEAVPGGFAEYTFSPSEKFDAVAGIRGDHNNLFGWFATPRIHLRYQPVNGTSLRASTGRGQRTANIFAENTAALVSSRQVVIVPTAAAGAYGLRPEVAWNKGLSLDQDIRLFNRQAGFSVEFFRNDFSNQVVTDYENPREIRFYNLEGKSYSNSLQAEWFMYPLKALEMRLAYRFFDVKTTYGNQLLEKPLVARHRGFLNLGYATPDHWHFDYTFTITGQKRLPSTQDNPEAYRLGNYSESYVLMNAQVSKTIGRNRPFDLYIGGENLTNFFQYNPILAADQPFSEFFDSSILWGPLSGRMFYAGIRFKIDRG